MGVIFGDKSGTTEDYDIYFVYFNHPYLYLRKYGKLEVCRPQCFM